MAEELTRDHPAPGDSGDGSATAREGDGSATAREGDRSATAREGDGPATRRDDTDPSLRAGGGREPHQHGQRTGLLVTGLSLLAVLAIAVGSLVAVGSRVGGWFSSLASPFTRTETDRSGPVVLQAITDVGEYRAASGYYEVVVDVQQGVDPIPSFLVGQRTLVVAAGRVDAVVDMSELDPGAVRVNGDRTSATVRLPPARLGEATLDLDRSYVVSADRGIYDRLSDAFGGDGGGEDTRALLQRAEQRVTEAAGGSDDLTARAEDNTRDMLESLLTGLGFEQVTVEFTAG